MASILQKQEMRGERLVNHFRLAFCLMGLAAMVPAWPNNTATANLVFLILGLCWLVYCLVLYIGLLVFRDRYWPWLKFVTVTLDLTLQAGTALAAGVNHSGLLEYFRSGFIFLFVFWTLFAGFRFSMAAGLYSAFLSLVLNSAILWFAVASGRVEATAVSIYSGPAINVVDQGMIIFFISMPGVVAGIIAGMGRSLVRRAEDESLQRARLQKEKGRLRRYLSKDLVELVLEDPDRLEMGGSRQTATIMFTNVRNFTPFSERQEPEEVVNFLNLYFTRMVSIVFRTGGTLDKYMGDGLLAEYGVPFPVTKAPLRSVTAALEMVHALHDFNESAGLSELAEVEIGVGIATGPVVAGNIGSLERMEYTCIGDTVNTGARLEKLNRDLGSNIIICEQTYKAVKDFVVAHRIPPMKAKGKEPMAIYAVEIPDDVPSVVEKLYEEMVRGEEELEGEPDTAEEEDSHPSS